MPALDKYIQTLKDLRELAVNSTEINRIDASIKEAEDKRDQGVRSAMEKLKADQQI